MSDAVEVVKAFVSPCEKLIDAVTRAIGKVYEPHHIRRMADAKAYEIATISYALNDSSDIPIIYDNGTLSMDTRDWESFIKRTQNRLTHQELIKQANIESVIDKAHICLEDSSDVTNDPVDQDWMLRFFNSVENISNEKLQFVWAKILAGEVKQPGSVSIRALELLKNLSQSEAQLFQKILPFVLMQREDCFIFASTKILAKFGINFQDILVLDECGLLLSSGAGVYLASTEIHNAQVDRVHSLDKVVVFHFAEDNPHIGFQTFPLTKVGCELFRILSNGSCEEYLHDFTKFLENQTQYKSVKITVHALESSTNSGVDISPDILWSHN